MIHVFKRNIGKKDDKGRYLPAIAVKDSFEGDYSAYRVAIYGYCEIVYRPDRPFRSGAKVWIETFAPIRADIAEPFSNILSSALLNLGMIRRVCTIEK